MLEETTMDKMNRSTLPQQTKAAATDSKKTPDSQNGKQLPRGNRKREPSGSNGFKNETKRPPPQKSKICEKRPKPRGFNYSSRKESTQINELEEEFGIPFNGGKRQNLNHLLNFHYEPRGSATSTTGHRERHNYTKSLMATRTHKYNKEQFLQANCQFVVRANGDYNCNLSDPDLLVDWDKVVLIRAGSREMVACPICLYPPTAAKITRCGHIYCCTCILHYLALSDKSWRKCPICYEAIHKNDLKSVECFNKHLFSVGEEITLQLMKRERGSCVASPLNEFESRLNKPILSLAENKLGTVFSKILIADRSDINKINNQEEAQLKDQLKECEGCPELCFVEQAIENLQLRVQKLDVEIEDKAETKKEEGSFMISKATEKDKTKLQKSKQNQSPGENNSTNYDYFQDKQNSQLKPEEISLLEQDGIVQGTQPKRIQSESCSSDGNDVTVEDLDIGTSTQPVKYFYFYQSTDGQEIYLHALNVKLLEKTYGSLDRCPTTIKGKIVEKEFGSMTVELRKRLKYLEHIPITCQFEVVELTLPSSIIPPEVTQEFKEQIYLRKRRREKLAKAEKRREKKLAERERREFGSTLNPYLHIESRYHFPGCGEFSDPELPPISRGMDSASSTRSNSPFERGRNPIETALTALSLEPLNEETGTSFAQMLREGGKIVPNEEIWPTVGDCGATGGSPAKSSSLISNWGFPRRQREQNLNMMESDFDITDFSPPARPTFNIAEAIEAATIMEKEKEQNAGRKKKRKQQKILFSTGMSCP